MICTRKKHSLGRELDLTRIVIVVGIVLVFGGLLAGCMSTPSSLRAEWEHTSHPFAGPPFGPAKEEDTLDTLNVITRWQRGRFYAETGLGYRLADGGFYGPGLTFTSRIGVELWRE